MNKEPELKLKNFILFFVSDYFSDQNSVVFFVYRKTFIKNSHDISSQQKQMTLEFFKYSTKIPIGILVENADVFGFYFVQVILFEIDCALLYTN